MKRAIGPYQISERIGTGGMGEVFKARDDRLDRWVAIKRIRPGKEDTDENRQRFDREARATAKLNHPSVVHIYDTLLDGESHCIVMEYVEGPTLQSMTAEGPLSALRATEIGREIAEGLAAAHAKHILHRDLKTENIMVPPEGRAKILDFGLAKPLISKEFDSSLTGKGQLVGTSRAMSPEYVGGDKVDHRSDLFALGVLLYEISTGQSPFKAQNTLATLKQVIVHQQPPVRELNPDMPQEFSDLVDRLLEKSPEDRPQSASEVVAEFGRISGYFSSGAVDRSSSSPSHSYTTSNGEWSLSTTMSHPRLRRFWGGVIALIAAALIGAFFLGGRLKRGSITEKEKILVVLGDFQNKTNDPLLDDSLNIALRTGLEQSRLVDILPDGQVQGALTRMQRDPGELVDRVLGIEICQREGAQALIIGTIVSFGSSYSLSAQIIDPQDRSIYTAGGSASNQGEILEALNEVVQKLRSEFGESLAAIESNPPLHKVTTHNLEALKLYYYGLVALDERDREEAISLLEQALDLDADFAMAYAKLGVIYQSLGQVDKVLYSFSEALKRSDRLTPSETHYVNGWMANLQGTPEDMIRAWKLMTTLYPNNDTGHHNLGMVYRFYQNQFAEAAEVFRDELPHLEKKRQHVAAHPLGYCELALGNDDAAISAFKSSDELKEGLADVYAAQERYEEALETLSESKSRDPQAAVMYKAQYYIDQGQFARALPFAREALELAVQQNSVRRMLSARMTLISSLQHSGSEQLKPALADAVEKANLIFHDESVTRLLTPIPFLATLGKIHVRAGDIHQAEVIYDLIQGRAKTSEIGLWIAYLSMLEGEILIAKGQIAEGLDKITEAALTEGPYQAHESRAYALELQGAIAEAIQQNEWIESRRGRAFAECLLVCCVRSQNILDWNMAIFRLGRLHESNGQLKKAEKYYQQFTRRWAGGDPNPALKEALTRLEALARM